MRHLQVLARERANLAAGLTSGDKASPDRNTPHVWFHRAYDSTIENLDNPVVKSIMFAQDDISTTFLRLSDMAKKGELKDHENFLEICQAFEKIAIIEQDPTGKKKHGMRWSPRLRQIAVLMRGYGNGSMQMCSLFAGMIPMPHPRHIKYVWYGVTYFPFQIDLYSAIHRKIAAKMQDERMASPDLVRRNLVEFKAQCDRLGYKGPVVCATDNTKVSQLRGTKIVRLTFFVGLGRSGSYFHVCSGKKWQKGRWACHWQYPSLRRMLRQRWHRSRPGHQDDPGEETDHEDYAVHILAGKCSSNYRITVALCLTPNFRSTPHFTMINRLTSSSLQYRFLSRVQPPS